jgi:hypothetical protein
MDEMNVPPAPPAIYRSLPASPSAVTNDRVRVRDERLGIAVVEVLELTRAGDRAKVHKLRMKIPQEALLEFLAEAIAGGPVSHLSVKPLSKQRLGLEARAFGWPTRAVISLSAAGGRARMDIESAQFGWFPVSARMLRDQILASSEPEVVRNGDVKADGTTALSFAPDYLFSHVVAKLPAELAKRGLPPHLDVHLTRIAVGGGAVDVEGGD